mmetsp:Transcript_64111/g.138797  ORF Transcript_64111/g.138797 Transcript_64111/m.138797 type:complete len:323 (-) Transcript_64111:55-1023(-)
MWRQDRAVLRLREAVHCGGEENPIRAPAQQCGGVPAEEPPGAGESVAGVQHPQTPRRDGARSAEGRVQVPRHLYIGGGRRDHRQRLCRHRRPLRLGVRAPAAQPGAGGTGLADHHGGPGDHPGDAQRRHRARRRLAGEHPNHRPRLQHGARRGGGSDGLWHGGEWSPRRTAWRQGKALLPGPGDARGRHLRRAAVRPLRRGGARLRARRGQLPMEQHEAWKLRGLRVRPEPQPRGALPQASSADPRGSRPRRPDHLPRDEEAPPHSHGLRSRQAARGPRLASAPRPPDVSAASVRGDRGVLGCLITTTAWGRAAGRPRSGLE